MIADGLPRLSPLNGHRVLPSNDKVALAVTERSVWVITACAYLRVRRDEFGARLADETLSLWGRLDDDVWHCHGAAYWRQASYGFIINLRPVAGPPDGYGITTGVVEASVALDRADLFTDSSVFDAMVG